MNHLLLLQSLPILARFVAATRSPVLSVRQSINRPGRTTSSNSNTHGFRHRYGVARRQLWPIIRCPRSAQRGRDLNVEPVRRRREPLDVRHSDVPHGQHNNQDTGQEPDKGWRPHLFVEQASSQSSVSLKGYEMPDRIAINHLGLHRVTVPSGPNTD